MAKLAGVTLITDGSVVEWVHISPARYVGLQLHMATITPATIIEEALAQAQFVARMPTIQHAI